MTNEDKIKRWLAEELSDSESKQFESTEEFVEIDRLMKAVNTFKAPEYNVDNEYGRLGMNSTQHKTNLSLYRRISPLLRIAAILIVGLTIGYFSYDHFKGISNNQEWIAEQTEVYLPDSSFVSLNKGSKVRFSRDEWGKERNVELNGEAFFSVKKGSQFNVKTQQGTVTVLGTEFGVKDRNNFYEVTCYSGLVKVNTEHNSVVLHPNTVFRIVNDKEESYSIPIKSEPDWLNGESSFKSVPLRFVINELERHYKVSVKAKDVNLNQLFTGRFSHDNLEVALESITIPVNLNYKMNANKTVITFEGK